MLAYQFDTVIDNEGVIRVPSQYLERITSTVKVILLSDEEPFTEDPKTGFGCLKGQIWMADDFDAPLDCFKEYME